MTTTIYGTEGVDYELRFIAGISMVQTEWDPKEMVPSISVMVLAESIPMNERLGVQALIPAMTTHQAEHLWMQLGRALGKPDPT